MSVNFLTKSIESWFDVKVESALEGGLTLGQKTIDILMSDIEVKRQKVSHTQLEIQIQNKEIIY